MVTTRRRFYNPHNVKLGATDVNTVQSISYTKTWQRLAGQGDDDVTDSFQAKTNLQVNGNLVIQDPVQADFLIDAAEASLTWQGQTSGAGAKKNVTVTGVSFFSLNETDGHNALDSITLGWNAYEPTGVDPVTVALASPPSP
jgi:hypothetical protein